MKTSEMALRPELPDSDGWVCLLVGGTEFLATRATLENAGGFFSSLFSSSYAPCGGRILIDRDAEAFPYILSYLRTLENFEAPSCPRLLRILKREADFFGLDGLRALLARPTHRLFRIVSGSSTNVEQVVSQLLSLDPPWALSGNLLEAVGRESDTYTQAVVSPLHHDVAALSAQYAAALEASSLRPKPSRDRLWRNAWGGGGGGGGRGGGPRPLPAPADRGGGGGGGVQPPANSHGLFGSDDAW